MYGLIGKPLGHSFSQKYFTKKFTDEKIDESYHLFELDSIDDVVSLVDSHPDLRGFNVTIPYKKQIIPYLESLSEEASEIGAVNVVKIERGDDGKVVMSGHNSDAPGFLRSLDGWLGKDVRKALILGTGGASLAVEHSLHKLGIETVKVSRKPMEGQLSYDDIDEKVMKEFRLIVNSTPVGTFPVTDAAPAVPYNLLGPDHYCYDLVYNPETTKFMRLAAERGAKVKNGLDMLFNQAKIAWEIWNNK